MAHRKPLGTLCHTNADWPGEKPCLHDALVTAAGTWYRIVGVEEKTNPDKIGLTLERVAPQVTRSRRVHWDDGYSGAVHVFEWYPRDRKRAV